jgi:hypothetical protein
MCCLKAASEGGSLTRDASLAKLTSLAIGPLVCNILSAVHALTGCDTTSSFFGIGKKTVYKTLIQNPQKFQNTKNHSEIKW